MNRLFSSLLVIGLLLGGCANETTGNYYYQLDSHQFRINHQLAKSANIASQSMILLEPIQLADFLRQPGIVIQQGQHQLQLSSIHRWADSLEHASLGVVQLRLEEQLPDYRFERQGSKWKSTPKIRVKIELTQFQINNQANQTITAGQYWIFDSSRKLITKQHFSILQPLDVNGYEHAVSQLESSLKSLAELIAKDIKGN